MFKKFQPNQDNLMKEHVARDPLCLNRAKLQFEAIRCLQRKSAEMTKFSEDKTFKYKAYGKDMGQIKKQEELELNQYQKSLKKEQSKYGNGGLMEQKYPHPNYDMTTSSTARVKNPERGLVLSQSKNTLPIPSHVNQIQSYKTPSIKSSSSTTSAIIYMDNLGVAHHTLPIRSTPIWPAFIIEDERNTRYIFGLLHETSVLISHGFSFQNAFNIVLFSLPAAISVNHVLASAEKNKISFDSHILPQQPEKNSPIISGTAEKESSNFSQLQQNVAPKTNILEGTKILSMTRKEILILMEKRGLIEKTKILGVYINTIQDGFIFVGDGTNDYKWTKLGQGYVEQYFKNSNFIPEHLIKRLTELSIDKLEIIIPKNNTYSGMPTSKQRHMLAASNEDKDHFYVIDFLTSAKGGSCFTVCGQQFKIFQDQLNGKVFTEEEKAKNHYKKTQQFMSFLHVELIPKKDVYIAKDGNAYFNVFNKQVLKDITEKFNKIKTLPYKWFNIHGVTANQYVEICNSFDENTQSNLPHPKSTHEIEMAEQAKKVQKDKQFAEKQAKPFKYANINNKPKT